ALLPRTGRAARAPAGGPAGAVRQRLAAAGVLRGTGAGRRQPDPRLPRPVQRAPVPPAAADLGKVPLPRAFPTRRQRPLLRPPVRPHRPGRRDPSRPRRAELEAPAALPGPAQPARPFGGADRVGAALLLQIG